MFPDLPARSFLKVNLFKYNTNYYVTLSVIEGRSILSIMKRIQIKGYCILFLLVLSYVSIAQSKLKPEFDAKEYLEVLHLEWAHQDSTSKYLPPKLPTNYKRVYRSPEVGLNNKFDVWLRDDSVGVICIRYTSGGLSWLENFYSGMIKATGTLHLNDSINFSYKFSNDEKALVHHGWTIGVAYLMPLMTQKINEYYRQGVKEFIIVGHSQGAAMSYLTRSYLEYASEQIAPKNIRYKVYCSAAPKPGNLFYAYDFDFITRTGWAYRIVNAADWVPATPFTIETMDDLYPLNPFSKRKQILKKRTNPLIRWYVNHAIKDIDQASKKVNRKYKKYLTKRTSKFVKQNLKQYKSPDVEKSNYYMPAGIPIVLQPDSGYTEKFKSHTNNVFVNHLFEPYIYLTELQYLKK